MRRAISSTIVLAAIAPASLTLVRAGLAGFVTAGGAARMGVQDPILGSRFSARDPAGMPRTTPSTR